MNIKKIVIISESIDVNDSSCSKGNVALIENLGQCGFELIVYHYTRKEIQLQGIECFPIPEKKWNGLYLLSRSQRYFTSLTKININPFIERIFGFSFTFFNDIASIKKVIKKEINFIPDLIITLSKGTSFRPHYAMMSFPELHCKWMPYVHDPYPTHYYPRPYHWIEPGYKIKENFFG